ncbi:hypothetical protein PRIPAC_91658 [Pristionchus pacificus]|uniref:Uncharacterized protein n=1 Tax=Pristionchus pacificus TaxID=54126 RepID=A0A2A6CEB1_PRIPA|nr:hypothetical protein PRIPAC_91658 [Pristionchus pacificus]|eukprot:PDM76393.1 hypothetical protein PRIPAC_39997 [Pristionchus pacificus]
MLKISTSLNALPYVNHRVHRFFQFPREIRGLNQKETFAKLCISQLKDGSVLLLFRAVAGQNFAQICKRSGEEERFLYSTVKLTTAHAHRSTSIKSSNPSPPHETVTSISVVLART